MSIIKININDVAQHQEAAQQLLEFAGSERVFLFDAPMGSGKTTFIKSLCHYLGVKNAVSSPTYSIVNEYEADDMRVYHFDLYRLKSEAELIDIGIEDYLIGNNYVFIEWPELIMTFITSAIKVEIKFEDNIRYIYAQLIKSS
ncbi:MAG: tRNA (adenosine(37)-N6)-threonylcarbamoyltransferase complex ATPase subunit type 1 TsaE [Bacteroidia bacterium]|nr:tRNA (adenosine(37)-N6)-threonylcarbamoyltransferase complex ATPase subunit type 1 TsaE [Bacteroidia bacterium]